MSRYLRAVLGLAVSAAAFGEENLLSLERIGAGPAAGWFETGTGYTWEAEEIDGPIGPGAARIRLQQGGRLSLESPARPMRAGRPHAACLWVRSEPAGAVVRLALRDNDTEKAAGLDERVEAGESWQRISRGFELPKGVRDCYYLDLSVSGSECTVWLDGLWLGEHEGPVDDAWQPAFRPAGVSLEPVAPWGLVAGDGPLRMTVSAAGAPGEGRQLRIRCTGADGTSSEMEPLPVPATATWRQTVELKGAAAERFGMLRVEAQLTDAAGAPLSATTETVLARVPEPVAGPLPESYFGAHTKLEEPDLEVARKLGFKWLRIHDASAITKWGRIEPEPGQWIWHDDTVELTRKHGFRILGMLDGSPAWESGTTQEGYFSIYGAPRSLDNWRNYVHKVVQHYEGQIDDWEVWNEPWDMGPDRFFQNGSPQLYVELMKAAYEEAKRANPNATLVGVDTFPPEWDQAVLALGGYGHYDVLSWHRYDATLAGHPKDFVARQSERLRAEQAKYGEPKPLLCSEGGLEIAPFQGSYFSFADPEISGDWSLGADVVARLYLSSIASGNLRFFLYTLHGRTRHGEFVGAGVEPGPLLRPYHAALAALAHFVDGAPYEKRLNPGPDVAAHLFARKDGGAVAVLVADGQDPEPLPKPLPEGVACFDRWGNAIDAPKQALRSPAYLVAPPEQREALVAALDGARAEAPPSSIHPMVASAIAALGGAKPDLWTHFSPQASVAVVATPEGYATATRAQLRDDPAAAARFKLPEPVSLGGQTVTRTGGHQAVGWVEFAAAGEPWAASFAAIQDGPGDSWRLVSLAAAPRATKADPEPAIAALRQWEKAIQQPDPFNLREYVYPEPFCGLSYTPMGGTFLFTRPEFHIAVLARGLTLGPAQKSVLEPTQRAVTKDMGVICGRWDVASPLFGQGMYAFHAIALRTEEGWKVASVVTGPEEN